MLTMAHAQSVLVLSLLLVCLALSPVKCDEAAPEQDADSAGADGVKWAEELQGALDTLAATRDWLASTPSLGYDFSVSLVSIVNDTRVQVAEALAEAQHDVVTSVREFRAAHPEIERGLSDITRELREQLKEGEKERDRWLQEYRVQRAEAAARAAELYQQVAEDARASLARISALASLESLKSFVALEDPDAPEARSTRDVPGEEDDSWETWATSHFYSLAKWAGF